MFKKQMIFSVATFFLTLDTFSYMDLQHPRGEKTIHFTKNEMCIIPRKFPNINPLKKNESNYSAKDLQSEIELCEMDFQSETDNAVGVCPKLHNTNPGLEIYKLPLGTSKAQLENQICDKPSELREGNKLAKYKLSTSCSYTPSMLAYYHVSRIMGNLLKVPPAVLRTMDAESYKSIPLKGQKTLAQGGVIAATWKAVLNQLNNPTTDKRGPYIFTTDYSQIFGGLLKNPKGESHWSEISNHAGGDQIDRGKAFMQEEVYLDLINENLASHFVGQSWDPKNVQKLQIMADASDMLVMDFLLRQEDRFNNIAYKLEVTGLSSTSPTVNEIKSIEVKNAQSAQDLNTALVEFKTKYNAEAFPIKRMMLKDNDCGVAVESGVARTGIVEKLKMLENVRHLKKSTYDQLLRLQHFMTSASGAAFSKDFFIRETLMTEKDYAQFALNTKRLAEGMKALCLSGKLHLDLDAEIHFLKGYKPHVTNCSLDE